MSFVILLTVRCTNDKDAYFDRPGWLEPPIYDVLKNQGRFSKYLQCVDRTLWAAPLKTGGLYTVFAPNDSAFNVYLQSKNLSSVEDMPDSMVNKIVSYSIVFNNYHFERLTDILSGGWDTLSSIRKKTTYYEPIYQTNYQGKNIWVYDLPGSSVSIGTVVEQNNKYMPMYMAPVFENNRNHAQAVSDYGMFYNTSYTGKNIQSADILQKDMISENGVAHEINQVLEPLPNLEKMLNDPNYSSFNELINLKGSTGSPYFLSYTPVDVLTKYFKTAYPDRNIDNVYMKVYNLPFQLCGEKFGTTIKETEKGGYTMFAPTNKGVEKFYKEKLQQYYPNGITTAPYQVLYYFINAQLIDDMVWPGDYKGSMNSLGEFFNGKGYRGEDFNAANYNKIAPASNGLFYGSDNYVKSRYFETVFTEIFLNPRYSLFNQAFSTYFALTLREELLQCELNGYTQENYTILLPPDSLLQADGFSYGWLSGSNAYGFSNSNSGSTLGNFDVATRMQRLVKSHIFRRLKNDQVNCAITSFTTDPSFATAYNGYSYAVNEYGDMIRYKDGKLQMLGNYDENDWVTATPYKTFLNGQVFKIDKLLQYSRRNTATTEADKYKSQDLYLYLQSMGTSNTNISTFINYLTLCLKGSESNELAAISTDMTLTFFIPSNTAMTKAVKNGDLPPYSLVSSGDVAARQKATKFLLYHIVNGKEYVDDGLTYIMPNKEVITEEVAPTLLKDVVDNTYLAIRKDASGKLVVSTQAQSTGRKLSSSIKTVTIQRIRSNYFGAKAVLHEIGDYFIYNKAQ